jgi:hypothetical protein
VSESGRSAPRSFKTIFQAPTPFKSAVFAHIRVPGWIASQNNSSLQRIEGGAQRGLIRSL